MILPLARWDSPVGRFVNPARARPLRALDCRGSVTLTLAHYSISVGYGAYYFVDGAYQSLVIGD
jgi:hypothetical protein